jgi:TRAP-type C4-dicarboxylate transport system permease small subunit
LEKTVRSRIPIEKAIHPLEKTLSGIGRVISWFGGLVLVGIIALIVIDVTLRYVFNRPFSFTIEVVELALLVVVLSSILLCTISRGHLVIDVLVARFSKRGQAIINAIMHFLCVGVCVIIAWRSIVYAIYLSEIGNVSTLLKMPLYPFSLFIAFCSSLMAVILLVDFFRYVIEGGQK